MWHNFRKYVVYRVCVLQEGIVNADMVIAPPTARKRHRRELHVDVHTLWKKTPEILTFMDDELFGTYWFNWFIDMLQNITN